MGEWISEQGNKPPAPYVYPNDFYRWFKMISQASETIKFARVWRIFKRFLYSTMERIAKYEVNRSKMTRRLGIHMAKHKKIGQIIMIFVSKTILKY